MRRLEAAINHPTKMCDCAKPDEFRIDAGDPRVPYDRARKDG